MVSCPLLGTEGALLKKVFTLSRHVNGQLASLVIGNSSFELAPNEIKFDLVVDFVSNYQSEGYTFAMRHLQLLTSSSFSFSKAPSLHSEHVSELARRLLTTVEVNLHTSTLRETLDLQAYSLGSLKLSMEVVNQ